MRLTTILGSSHRSIKLAVNTPFYPDYFFCFNVHRALGPLMSKIKLGIYTFFVVFIVFNLLFYFCLFFSLILILFLFWFLTNFNAFNN